MVGKKGNDFFRLWKKGIIVGLAMAVVGFVYTLIFGVSINLIALTQSLSGVAGLAIVGFALAIIVIPIIRGWLIEWVNKRIK